MNICKRIYYNNAFLFILFITLICVLCQKSFALVMPYSIDVGLVQSDGSVADADIVSPK